MKGTILQPTYLPWIGYFEMIARSQLYICFDHVQFAAKSWQQRNRIKGPNGPVLLSVPVLSSGGRDVRIRDKRIDYGQGWVRKHLRSIEFSYRKTPWFEMVYLPVERILSREHANVADMNLELISMFLSLLGLNPRIARSSEIDLGDETRLDRTGRVVNLCRKAGVTHLLDGKSAEDILDSSAFSAAGVSIEFQRYEHPVYPQMHGPFLPYMSIVDLLMNCGEGSLEVVLGRESDRR